MHKSPLPLVSFLAFSLLFLSCEASLQSGSGSKSIASKNSGRVLGLKQKGDRYELVECRNLESFEGDLSDCKVEVEALGESHLRAVEASLDAQLQKLNGEPSILSSLSRFFRTPIDDGGALVNLLRSAVQEIQQPTETQALDEYVFENLRMLLRQELEAAQGKRKLPSPPPRCLYQTALSQLLISRCRYYEIQDPNCARLAGRFIEILDLSALNKYNLNISPVLPEWTLRNILADDVFKVLERIAKDHPETGPRGAIYAALQAEIGSKRALEVMASLFQDQQFKSQLDLIAFTAFKAEQLETVSRNFATLRSLIDPIIDRNPGLAALPGISDPDEAADRAYHIFVPAFAVSKLIDEGADPKLAAQIAFMFNTIYEYLLGVPVIEENGGILKELEALIKGDLSAFNSVIESLLGPFADPKSFDHVAIDTKEDLYFGYVAGLLGSRGSVAGIKDYEFFAASFFSAPYAFTRDPSNF